VDLCQQSKAIFYDAAPFLGASRHDDEESESEHESKPLFGNKLTQT
jgi:hypothetical protein